MSALSRLITPDDWKRSVALVILWAYAYQLVAWPILFWVTTIGTAVTGTQWPSPPLVPWESMIAGTATLGTIGGIETWREGKRADQSKAA